MTTNLERIIEVHSSYALDIRLEEFTLSLTSDMDEWKKSLKSELGNQLTGKTNKSGYPSTWFSRRLDRTAQFPHRNTGALQKSIDYSLKAAKQSPFEASITVETQIKSDSTPTVWKKDPTKYYNYTNDGLPSKNGSGAWINWLDSVTNGNGRGSVRSV